jgi:hypothetical protein
MKVPLLKWYKRVIPLLLLFCLFGNRLSAFSPDCPIVAANFSGLSDGTTVNNGTTGWFINSANVASGAIFWVKSNRFHAQELGGEGVWYSKVFSVAGYTDFQIATKITSEGDMNSSEYVKVYYKINGGAEILLDQRTGNFGTIDFVSPLLNGNNVQFVVRIYNYNNGGSQTSKYYIEDYRVFKEHGPCAGGIPVSVSAGNNGVLTCANASLTLSASSSASGVTYSWTGPSSFTSTSQNPVITVAGTYNVVATSSTGSGSASITITSNKTQPDVTATGASLGCASSVTINATSPVANAQYAWTGPGFSSTQQNPVVTTAGTYTVVVTNPANGCTASRQVQVTAGGSVAPGTFWLEDFTFANGTTSDAGTTAWTLENTAAGTFSVQNNELMASFNAANEGVWKSDVINISSKSNVVFSLNLRSGTAGSSDAFEDDDYIRVYYKLNGGAETLLFSDINGLKGTTTGTAYDTVTSSVLNGSSLQIIVRLRNSNSTERYYLDNVKLTGYNTGTAPLAVSVNGVATCTSNAQLQATATSAVSSWSWTGPNSFTSSAQNPSVSVGGQYIVTANFTDGCSATLPVTVTENKTAPGVTASGGSLACFSSIVINANSALTTATYSWTGPNSFASTVRNPSVTAAGTYTVTATNPANGCTSTQSVQVTPAYGVAGNLWVEDFTLSNGTTSDNGTTAWTVQIPSGATAAVNSNQLRFSNVGTTNEAVWTSGNINIAGKANVSITAGVRSSITGSAVMNETGEFADYIRFYYQLDNGAIVQFSERRGVINSHSTTLTNLSVGSLSGSSLRIIVRARATGNDEFYHFDNVTVSGSDQNTLSVIAAANGTINCSNPAVTLTGTSATAGLNYNWSGPGGFASTLQSPSVSVAGIYQLTVTDPSTNCTATDTALVSTSLVAGNIWQEAFPVNGINVDTDATPWSVQAPSGAVAATNGNQFRVSNTGTTGEAVWTSGSINIAGKTNVTISAGVRSSITGSAVMNETGEYADYIRLYYKLNNGAEVLFYEKKAAVNSHSSTLTPVSISALSGNNLRIVVRARATGNDEFYYFDNMLVTGESGSGLNASATVSDTLTCTTTSVTLLGSSTAPGVTYSWTGPGGFTASTQNANVTEPGAYTLTVASGSCTGTATVNVVREYLPPANLTITRSTSTDTLTCNVNHVIIFASSSTAGTQYTWTGPNGYIANGPGITIFNPGEYTVVAQHPVSGCRDTASYVVHVNRTFPGASTNPITALLSCTNPSIVITAGSTATTVKYSWTGPGGLTATGPTVTATAAGNYFLLVTDTVNGCTTSTTATMVEGRTTPSGLTITAPSNADAITCTNSQVTLTGNAASGNVNYSWTGPGGFHATTSVINATVEGEYTMTATGTASGCTASVKRTIVRNMAAPASVSITPVPANAQITCTFENVTLTGNSATPGVTYSWTGPSFTSNIANPAVNTAGAYVLTVTDPANGCTTTANITVTSDKTPPAGVTAFSADLLTCFRETVNITGNSGTPGVTYSWTGPGGFTANTRIAPVSVAGPYQLKVTNPANGCFGNAVANVMQNITKPDISVSNTGPLTCDIFEVEIQGSSTTADVDYSWTGPEGFASNSPVEFVYTPGDYILTVLDLNNGCSSIDTTTVLQDLTGCQRAGTAARSAATQSETAAGKMSTATQVEYRAYPNPFTNRLNVEFKTPQNAQVNVGIYSAVGTCNKVLFNGKAQAGQLYKLPYDATVLPPGMYYCVVRINEKVYTIKLIAIKK